VTHGRWLDLWYHFAIMFEALFILTTLDAGTRVGRYLLQDVLGSLWKPLGETRRASANVLASSLVVLGWGYFLIQGVRDPLGGINSLWPLFGIANQLLASIALCLATTILLKMQLAPPRPGAESPETKVKFRGRPALALVTILPLAWLLSVTMTAGYQKIFNQDPRIGFLAQVRKLEAERPALERAVTLAAAPQIEAAKKAVRINTTLQFNNRLDAVVAGIFLVLVIAVVVLSLTEWILLLTRRKPAELRESQPTWLPEYAVSDARPATTTLGTVALGMVLLKELSGEAAIDRAAAEKTSACVCESGIRLLAGEAASAGEKSAEDAYLLALKRKYSGRIDRCC
jgi:carbon starvation protein